MKRGKVVMVVVAALSLTASLLAQPSVPAGYTVEAYVTGLQNVNAIAFSPGGEFGYAGQLFVGDSRPNVGTIYRVPAKEQKINFATTVDNEPRSFEFAPVGSAFASGLYATQAYSIWRYNSSVSKTNFASISAFGWDLAFASDDRFRNHLFQIDGWNEVIREWGPTSSQTVLVNPGRVGTSGLAFGPGGGFGRDLYVAFAKPSTSSPPSKISRVTPEGVMTDFVTSSEFGQTNQLAFDNTGNFHGNLFVSDWSKNCIFEINPQGNVTVFANGFSFSQTPFHINDGGDLVFGPDGSLYVADGGAGTVWRITTIPEPCTLGLLLLGGLAVARRRK
jgi:hypothetical protein